MIVDKHVFDRMMQRASVITDKDVDILGREIVVHSDCNLEEIGVTAINADGSVEYALCGPADAYYSRSREAARANGWIQ